MAHEDDLRAVFGDMEKHFVAGRVGAETSFYFSLGDGPGHKWTVEVGPEACRVTEGKHVESADCVVKTTPDYFLRLVRGEHVPGAMDFMRGKIKSNDPMKLKILGEAFDLQK